jgi:predicted transcriptional regulator
MNVSSGRQESHLSRTLKKLERAGIVRMQARLAGRRTPVFMAQKVRLEIDLSGE